MQKAPALSGEFGDFAQDEVGCKQFQRQKLVVKNTFYDVQDDVDDDDAERPTLRRVASDSELSNVSLSSVGSMAGSVLSTPSNQIDQALRPGSSSEFSVSELWWGEIPQPPSEGSSSHSSGNCHPCSFFRRNKCSAGKDCAFCHFPHEKAKHPGKKARERAARRNVREEQIQAQEPEGKDLSLADIQAAAGLNF